MTMADIVAIASALLIIGLGFPALLMLITLIFPNAVGEISQQVGARPLRALGRGLLAFLLLTILITVTWHIPNGLFKLFSLSLLLGGFSLAMIGAAGLNNQLALRFGALIGNDRSVGNIICSALLIELAAALPLIGWFVIIPVVFLMMLGSGCQLLLPRRSSQAAGAAMAAHIS
jgi:hypothetical protein